MASVPASGTAAPAHVPARRWWVLALWAAAIVTDFATTLIALHTPGLREANPLPGFAAGQIGPLGMLTLGSLVCVTLAVLGVLRARSSLLRLLQHGLILLAAAKLLIAVHNWYLLSR